MNDPELTANLVQETFWHREDRFAMVAFDTKTAEEDLRRLGFPRMPGRREFFKERGAYWIKVGLVTTAADQSTDHYGIRFEDNERWDDRYLLTMGGQLLWQLARSVVAFGTPHSTIVKQLPDENGSVIAYVPRTAIEYLPILSLTFGELIVGFQFGQEHLPGQPGVGMGGCKDDWAIQLSKFKAMKAEG